VRRYTYSIMKPSTMNALATKYSRMTNRIKTANPGG
jgi:hypothetical protein